MKCPVCQTPVSQGEKFCSENGHPLPASLWTTQSGGDAPERASVSGTYRSSISRANPGCLVFLVDQSGSMEEPIAGGSRQKKTEVADAVNRLLYNTVLRCTKDSGTPWHYFDVGIWTYGGKENIRRVFSADLVPIGEVAQKPLRVEKRNKKVSDGAGGYLEQQIDFPVWLDATAEGSTPMNAAFRTALDPVKNWVSRHSGSFPPIVLNLTDGAYTDGSPSAVVDEFRQLHTQDGGVLVYNCHVSKETGNRVTFPNAQEAGGLVGFAKELFDVSSNLPAIMLRQASARGYTVKDGARGYVFNGELANLVDFLEIGTQVMQDRSE